MRLWYFSSSVNPFFKCTSAAVQFGGGVGWTLRLLPYYMCANSEDCGDTTRMRRLAWAIAGRLCGKYHNLMSWLKYSTIAISYHAYWNVQHWKGKRIFTVSIFVQHSDVMQMTTWSGRLDLMQMTHSELLGQFRESDSRTWPIRNSSSNSVNQTSDVCKVYYYVLNCSIPFAGRTCVRI